MWRLMTPIGVMTLNELRAEMSDIEASKWMVYQEIGTQSTATFFLFEWPSIRPLILIVMTKQRFVLAQNAACQWSGELSQQALTILHQHAIQGDVTALQSAVVRWVAFARKMPDKSINFSVLYYILYDLESQWLGERLSREEVRAPNGNENLTTYRFPFRFPVREWLACRHGSRRPTRTHLRSIILFTVAQVETIRLACISLIISEIAVP